MNNISQCFPPFIKILGNYLRLVDRANLSSVSKQFEQLNTKVGRNLTLAIRLVHYFANIHNKSTVECISKYIAHLVLGCEYSLIQLNYQPFADNNMLPHLVNIWMCQSGRETDPIDILVHGVSDSNYVNRYYSDIKRHFYSSKTKEIGSFEYVQVESGEFPPSAMISFKVTFRGKTIALDYINVGPFSKMERKEQERQLEIYEIFKHKLHLY